MNLIYVADLDKTQGRSRGVWSHSFGMEGHAGILLVNLFEIRRSRALLDAALDALPTADPRLSQGRCDDLIVRPQSDPGAPHGQQTGPFQSGGNADPNVAAFYWLPGWSAQHVAETRRPWRSSMCGPHAVALLVNHELGDWNGAPLEMLAAGARLALEGELLND